jgi:hypothetical protein
VRTGSQLTMNLFRIDHQIRLFSFHKCLKH